MPIVIFKNQIQKFPFSSSSSATCFVGRAETIPRVLLSRVVVSTCPLAAPHSWWWDLRLGRWMDSFAKYPSSRFPKNGPGKLFPCVRSCPQNRSLRPESMDVIVGAVFGDFWFSTTQAQQQQQHLAWRRRESVQQAPPCVCVPPSGTKEEFSARWHMCYHQHIAPGVLEEEDWRRGKGAFTRGMTEAEVQEQYVSFASHQKHAIAWRRRRRWKTHTAHLSSSSSNGIGHLRWDLNNGVT